MQKKFFDITYFLEGNAKLCETRKTFPAVFLAHLIAAFTTAPFLPLFHLVHFRTWRRRKRRNSKQGGGERENIFSSLLASFLSSHGKEPKRRKKKKIFPLSSEENIAHPTSASWLQHHLPVLPSPPSSPPASRASTWVTSVCQRRLLLCLLPLPLQHRL